MFLLLASDAAFFFGRKVFLLLWPDTTFNRKENGLDHSAGVKQKIMKVSAKALTGFKLIDLLSPPLCNGFKCKCL